MSQKNEEITTGNHSSSKYSQQPELNVNHPKQHQSAHTEREVMKEGLDQWSPHTRNY